MSADRGEPNIAVASVWDTFDTSRTVLMACRTLTSTIRLLETHELFRNDTRLEFCYAFDGGSRFRSGVARVLARAGVDNVIAWSQARSLRPNVTLAASENIDPDTVNGPIILLPHGIGFNKYVPTADAAATRVAGLPSSAALRSGRLRVVLTHPDQDHQLRTSYPEIAGNTVVTGDPTFDRLVASQPLRNRYRRLLTGESSGAERRIVLVSSTWGHESAVGRWHRLPAQLLAELPADSYQVCLVLHPNIWARYGPRAIRTYLADALDAGLLLLPPESGWHAAMVAADLVVADHGSLSLYAAALGTPLLLTGSTSEIVPGTPIASLAAAAPRLHPHASTAAQIEARLSAPYQDFGQITDHVFGHRGQAVHRLRTEMYRTIDLPSPDAEPPLPRVPDPQVPQRRGPWSLRVHTESDGNILVLTRFPASVEPIAAGHLVVTDAEPNLRLAERAAVLCQQHHTDPMHADTWTRDILTAYPGARLAAAAVHGPQYGYVARSRDGQRATITADSPDVTLPASTAYHCLITDGLRNSTITVSVGQQQFRVDITVS